MAAILWELKKSYVLIYIGEKCDQQWFSGKSYVFIQSIMWKKLKREVNKLWRKVAYLSEMAQSAIKSYFRALKITGGTISVLAKVVFP